jgi:small multidrug resistance pump
VHWVLLVLAIVFEVVAVLCMKASEGFKRLEFLIPMGICYAICFGLLTIAVKRLDIGTTYAIWSGIGTALIAVGSVAFFREQMNPIKAASIILIILGVAGLNIGNKMH